MSRFVACAVYLLILVFFQPAPAEAQNVGDAVPTFSLTGLDGKSYASASYKGSVLALYYLGHS